MVEAERLAESIRGYCQAHASPSSATKYARYFKEGYDAWGLLDKDNPIWHEQEEKWFTQYRHLGMPGFLKLGEILFRSGKYEEGALAIRFMTRFSANVDAGVLPRLSKWFRAGIGNWAHVDTLCGQILNPAISSGAIPLSALACWRKSDLRYQRRAVPVSLLGLVKRGDDVEPLLEFLRPMMLDTERVVHQGLGWFLREAWKKQPKPVEALLMEYRDSAARLIFQYATEKMSPAARNRFRRCKPSR
jgi:3-methyladenine DNA glycosylase AlkD